MSDAIQALNEIVLKAGRRGEAEDCAEEKIPEILYSLLEDISVIAGDAIENRVKATKPRKARVYKEIVNQFQAIIQDCSQDTPEGPPYALELMEEVLNDYGI